MTVRHLFKGIFILQDLGLSTVKPLYSGKAMTHFKWHHVLDVVYPHFKQNLNGMNWGIFLSRVIDDIVVSVWCDSLKRHPVDGVCVMAVGGYGRTICMPYSDVDIIFLCPKGMCTRDNDALQSLVSDVVKRLWDMGFEVGQSVYTCDDVMGAVQGDSVLKTALITHRYIAGNISTYTMFCTHYNTLDCHRDKDTIKVFMREKLTEKQNRRMQYGGTKYALEPNVKHTAGTLRDLDTTYWILRYGFPEMHTIRDLGDYICVDAYYAKAFDTCHHFFLTVRMAIHFLGNTKSDILSFGMQQDVANVLGYTDSDTKKAVEVFMGDYFRIVSQGEMINAVLLAVLHQTVAPVEKSPLPKAVCADFPVLATGVRLWDNAIYIEEYSVFENTPLALLHVFECVQKYGYDIHAKTIVLIHQMLDTSGEHCPKKYTFSPLSDNTDAHQSFLRILQGERPFEILRFMNMSGVLSCILPEWRGIYCQMQYNMYHDYTTDAHTIFAIRDLHRLRMGVFMDTMPQITQVANTILENDIYIPIIYMAVLLHDIAKGLGGDHAILGADMAQRICTRLGFEASAVHMVAWLVRYHLLLSHTAERRDIYDIKTIHDFAEHLQGVESLDLLLLLTVVDVRSVGKNVWTDWKQHLIWNVYTKTRKYLLGDAVNLDRERVLMGVRGRLSGLAGLDDILQNVSDEYLTFTPAHVLDWHVQHFVQSDGFCVAMRHTPDGTCSQIMVQCADTLGLTAKITRLWAYMRISVLGAHVHTLDGLGAVQAYRVQSSMGGCIPYTQDELCHRVRTVVCDDMPIGGRLDISHKADAFDVACTVSMDNEASYDMTILAIRAKNTMGVLAVICRVLSHQRISIRSARIASYGERVYDAFYIQDENGKKIYDSHRQESLKCALKKALQTMDI